MVRLCLCGLYVQPVSTTVHIIARAPIAAATWSAIVFTKCAPPLTVICTNPVYVSVNRCRTSNLTEDMVKLRLVTKPTPANAANPHVSQTYDRVDTTYTICSTDHVGALS